MAIGVTSGIEKPLVVTSAVVKNQLAAFSTGDDKAKKATDKTKAVIGVFMADAASGERVNVMLTGVAEVKLGAAVTRGDMITCDANGEGVAPAATGDYAVGIAVASGADGDIIPVLLSQCKIGVA